MPISHSYDCIACHAALENLANNCIAEGGTSCTMMGFDKPVSDSFRSIMLLLYWKTHTWSTYFAFVLKMIPERLKQANWHLRRRRCCLEIYSGATIIIATLIWLLQPTTSIYAIIAAARNLGTWEISIPNLGGVLLVRLRHVTISIPQSQEVEIPNEMLWHDFKQSVLGEVAIKVPTTRPAARLSHM